MSHRSEETENYWPGYVDALTSMVQVLAFVMMLLSMAVFVLSQNAAKSAIEEIAKAEQVNVPRKATVSELTEAIIEKIRNRPQAQERDKPPEAAAPALPRPVGPRPEQADRPIPVDPATPPTPPSLAAYKHLVVQFQNRSYDLHAAEAAKMARFLEDRQAVKKGAPLVLRAYAFSGAGQLTEERRVAYYRALIVRSALIERKVAPGKLQINVFDTTVQEQGATVEIFVIDQTAD